MTDAVLLQNVALQQQTNWVFIAIPKDDMPKTARGFLLVNAGLEEVKLPWVLTEHGIVALVSMPANTTWKARVVETEDKPREFAWHPALFDNAMAIAPSFRLGGVVLTPSLSVHKLDDARLLVHMRAHDTVQKVTVDCWSTIYSNHPSIEYVVQAVYGTTANDGQPQTREHAALVMTSAAKIHVDFAMRNTHKVSWHDGNQWCAEVMPAGVHHRAVRYELRGALLSMPDAGREHGLPIQGLYVGWHGSWLGLGSVPQATPDLRAVREQQREAYRMPRFGSYSDARPRCQPRESGTTGEQSDFGVASDLAVVSLEPWEIHDALWQCQSYAQRPTANKEPNGSPMRAYLHPDAEVHNQRPDLSLGVNDRLGWPGVNQIGWIPSSATTLWTTSDDQHRADNFLHATFLLTRDPALKQLIEDHIELDKIDVYVKRKWIPAPRAVGRLALTRANQIALGFPVAGLAVEQVKEALRFSPFTTLPPSATVRTLGGREQAKYGWQDANGQAVIGWQGWQETIALLGILALAKRTQDEELRKAAKLMARVVSHNCWLSANNTLRHAYAVAWNEGQPFPTGAWPSSFDSSGEGHTSFVYVSGACSTWTVAASDVIAAEDEIARLISLLVPSPRTIAEARWRSV
jgi:hypothetical protein